MPSLRDGYEKEPRFPVGESYRPPDSAKHLVSDGEDWQSVARRYNIPVVYLIESNFKTRVPEEVNWYLGKYVRCDKPTPDRKNWRFSTSARHNGGPRAGVVYIPLNWRAILAAAKAATVQLVNQWFRGARLDKGQVEGTVLTVPTSSVTPAIGMGSPFLRVFADSLRHAGAPDVLADTWKGVLYEGLQRFTLGIHDVASVFPQLGATGPRKVVPPVPEATPWPLLFSSKITEAPPGHATFKQILTLSGISGTRSDQAIRDYATWFQRAFETYRASLRAQSVVAELDPISVARAGPIRGRASARPGFLQGPPMRE